MKFSKEQPVVDTEFELDRNLVHFKFVIKSLLNDVSKMLGEIELASHGAEVKEKISLIDHYLDYARRLCETKDKS